MRLAGKLITFFIFFFFFRCNNNPVENEKPANHYPEIHSLTVFPEIASLGDSVVVVCTATDPDGDTLVYDWYTDARLKIKDANRDEFWLIHTFDNFRVFYPTNSNKYPLDTAWVQCFARDRKGKSDAQTITFIVKHNEGDN